MYPIPSRDELSSHIKEKRPVKPALISADSQKKQRTVTVDSEYIEWHESNDLAALWLLFFGTNQPTPMDDSLAPYLKQIRETIGSKKKTYNSVVDFWPRLQATEDVKIRFIAVLEHLEHQITLVDEPAQPPTTLVAEGDDQMLIEPIDEPYQPHMRVYDPKLEFHHWHPTMVAMRDIICQDLDLDRLLPEKRPVVARYLYEIRKMIMLLPPEDLVQFNEELPTVADLGIYDRMEVVHRWLMTKVFSIKTARDAGPISLEEELRLWPADWATTRRRLINIPLLAKHIGYDEIALVLRALRSAIGVGNDPRTAVDEALKRVNLNQPYPDVLRELIQLLRQSQI